MVSVIIPVYNAEAYLSLCINSIISQSYADWEIILVNDGSTDRSGKICDAYAQKDSRIHVLHQKNSGVSNARCNGVSKAKGEYITFVDADDELHTDALETLLRHAERDITIIASKALTDEIISGETFIKYILTKKIASGVTKKLFRSSLFSGYVDDVPRIIRIGEDELMNIKLVLGKEIKVRCIKDDVYYYRSNPDSVTYATKFSLKYEELFMEERLRVFGQYKARFTDELCYNNLKTLGNLIACRVAVPYSRPWVQEVINWGKHHPLTLRDWIVINIRHNLLCKYLLAIEKRIRRVFSHSN